MVAKVRERVAVTAHGEGLPVMFHPIFAIGPAVVGIALVSAASAQSAPDASAPAAPTACQMRLSDRAVFKPLGDIVGEPGGPGCGAPDAVLLQRIVVDDHTDVAVEPPATMRCEMAEAVADFVRHDLAPAADAMGSPLRAIANHDSYDCRGRNRVAGAKLSEHALANALDIRSVRLKDGRVVLPTDASASKVFRTAMKSAACDRFTTVLGPGSDGYHEDHIHVDRIERRSGYRLCQWDVRDQPRLALQSISTRSDAPPARASASAIPGPIPLPRPRPFKTAHAHAIIPQAESRHR
jgi:hypothetical protein